MGMFGNAFKAGGAGRDIAGYMGDALLNLSGGRPVYAPAKQAHQQQQDELQRMMEMAQYKVANPEQPDVIRSMIAAGIDPKSPTGQAIIQNNYSHPIVLGNAENGQSIVNPSAIMGGGGQPSGPPPEAVMRLKQNPHEAALFDEQFGQGAAARALGGQ